MRKKSLASAAAAFLLGAGALGGTALAGELVDGGMWNTVRVEAECGRTTTIPALITVVP